MRLVRPGTFLKPFTLFVHGTEMTLRLPALIGNKSTIEKQLNALSLVQKELLVNLMLVNESISKSNLFAKMSTVLFSEDTRNRTKLYKAWEQLERDGWFQRGEFNKQALLTPFARGAARVIGRSHPDLAKASALYRKHRQSHWGWWATQYHLDLDDSEERWLLGDPEGIEALLNKLEAGPSQATKPSKERDEEIEALLSKLSTDPIQSIKRDEEVDEELRLEIEINVMELLLNPWIPEQFSQLSVPHQFRMLHMALNSFVTLEFPVAQEVFEYAESLLHHVSSGGAILAGSLAIVYLRQGRWEQANALLNALPQDHFTYWQGRGTLEFMRGNYAEALDAYQQGFPLFNRGIRGRKHPLPGLAGNLMPLAMIGADPEKGIDAAVGFLQKLALTGRPFLKTLQSNLTATVPKLTDRDMEPDISARWLNLFLGYWSGDTQKRPYLSDPLLQTFQAHQFVWDLSQLVHLQHATKEPPFTSPRGFAKHGFGNLTELRPKEEEWERTLKTLSAFGKARSVSATRKTQQKRLAWVIDIRGEGITPVAQILNKSGNWTGGRAVALKRLKNGLPFMEEQDYQVASQVREYHHYYGAREYELPFEKAIPLLVGHPLLFQTGATELPLELVAGTPELLVQETAKGYQIKFPYQLKSDSSVVLQKETPTRYRVISFSQEQLDLLGAVEQKSVTIPLAGKEKLTQALENLSPIISITSPLGIGEEDLPEVPPSTRIHAHLLPLGEGLRLELLVRPLGDGGPYTQPGRGSTLWIGEVDQERKRTKRSLKKEQQEYNRVLAQAPLLSEWPHEQGEWRFEAPEDCLEILQELQELGEQVQVEWPEGQKLKLSRLVDFENLALRIKRHRDWFQVEGELRLSDEQTLSLQVLLNHLKQRRGRFVPIGDQEFLTLTDQFRKRLEELDAFTERSGNQLRLPDFAAPALEDWVESVGALEADPSWKERLNKLRDAQSLNPAVPSTLRAQLRDYQQEGFTWLTRLAHWDAGACLADDMGLGKTVQAIASMLERAPQGPALVLAPASVAINWTREIEKFAPTLRPVLLASENRQQVVQEAGAFDVIISSYGLLPQETETLCSRRWRTLVLDEAQAIKNAATKRSQSVMKLEADFRIATTGTPLENHLGELWNLFRFLNPGLLGSRERFQERFAGPIERDHDAETRQRLRKLIRPFILRRLKHEVLDELPPKTEIVLTVELSPEERVFYEALRQKALEDLENTSQQPPGARNLQILAEITRLRRACCHPKLVLPETRLPGSKLTLFQEVLGELLANRHKVLVFSQFVAHLDILREHLQQHSIAYQYLDGSTPQKQRQQAIDAFQKGEGEVFLISLKAGGTGLNLTAADYVIHMDPWWNPAVEDQASDRAHRMGQERPVTIYRLVTQGTIEEQIVSLHHEKRDLANSLLEGSDRLHRLSPEALLQLLKEDPA